VIVGLGSYYRILLARAWRDTLVFSRNQIIVSLIGTLLVAGGLYRWNADPSVTSGAIATVLAAFVIVVVTLLWNIIVVPWRLHEEQAARLREFERRPDVEPLIACRERGIQLLNQPVKDEHDLTFFRMDVRRWEAETEAELTKCGTKADQSEFRVLGLVPPRVFPGVITEHNAELAMLAERLERLRVVIRRIEGSAS
jgi:hypothetical protein